MGVYKNPPPEFVKMCEMGVFGMARSFGVEITPEVEEFLKHQALVHASHQMSMNALYKIFHPDSINDVDVVIYDY